jgi:hypothetical protein
MSATKKAPAKKGPQPAAKKSATKAVVANKAVAPKKATVQPNVVRTRPVIVPVPAPVIDRERFFAHIRRALFGGRLNQEQVDGMTHILNKWEAKHARKDLRFLAYAFATTFHEVDATMQPIEEYGRGKRHDYGQPGPHDGQIAFGRGYVMITHPENYERADRRLGLKGKLVKNYDLALQPDIAADIMFGGMLEGWFTGKKLSDYISGTRADVFNARRIINGLDKAGLIAGYYHGFAEALTHTSTAAPVTA